ncbi:hypothetical protein [Pseudomonas sp. REB1044]|uniref:hypothetical protein n=1 Tax=Pseudomonas sp. REB1044 TaxID=2675224 RepID=UPI00315CFAF2
MSMFFTFIRRNDSAAAWLRLLVLASLSCVLLLADDFIQQRFSPNNRAELEAGWVAGLWVFCLVLWLCNLRGLVVAILSVFAGMQLLQLANISFFGEPLSAIDIRSLLREPGEVRQTAWHSLGAHWHAAFSVLLPYSLLIARFDQLDGERYLVITGDHGQRLGENGQWGHNDLVPEVSDVPMIVISRDAPQQALEALKRERWISHYEIGKWLAARLGTRIDNPNLRANEHFVHGKLLFSDNFIQPVCETPAGLVHLPPMQLSQWLGKARLQGCGS